MTSSTAHLIGQAHRPEPSRTTQAVASNADATDSNADPATATDSNADPATATDSDRMLSGLEEQVSEWFERSPWGRFSRVLGARAPSDGSTSDDDLLRRMADVEALIAQLSAQQGRDLLDLRQRRLSAQQAEATDGHRPGSCTRGCCDEDGWVGLEVAQSLAVSERQVGSRIDTATRLARFTHVAAAVDQGLIQTWTATKLVQHLAELAGLVSPDRLEGVEQSTVAWLTDRPRTVGQLNTRMRRLIVAAREAAGQEPTRADARNRNVRINPPDTDGLAMLVARLPEADALAVRATLDALAADPVADDDTRTRDQRRADLVTALVTGVPARHGHGADLELLVRSVGDLGVHLDVTIPADALVGGGSPAEVPGYGPLPTRTARDLAESATSCRALVYDPDRGQLLGLSQQTGSAGGTPMRWLAGLPPATGYHHPPVMESLVEYRDVVCRAPGCARSATVCDCDHVTPWPRGQTTAGNTCCLCRRHHRLKTHAPGWTIGLDERGRLVWTTPTGRVLVTEPHDYSSATTRPLVDRTAEPNASGTSDVDPPPF